MVLTNSGVVSFTDIKGEFGGATTLIQLSAYRDGTLFNLGANGMRTGPAATGTISVGQLRGRWKNVGPDRYPPNGLTANTSTVSGAAYGNGTYVCTSSFNYSTSTPPYKAFDQVQGDWSTGWSCVPRYNISTGVYTGTTSTTVSGVAYAGEWMQVQFPSAVKLCRWALVPRSDFDPHRYTGRLPNTYRIAGSTNGSTWNLVTSIINLTYTDGNNVTHEIYDNSTPYSYWRWIIIACGNPTGTVRDGADIAEIRAFFTTS